MPFTIKQEDNKSLCAACKHSVIFTLHNQTRVTYCTVISKYIAQDVEQCSDYASKNSMSLYDMSRIAHILVNKRGGKIGFNPPKDRARNFSEADKVTREMTTELHRLGFGDDD